MEVKNGFISNSRYLSNTLNHDGRKIFSRQFIATCSRRVVTPKGSLVRESYPKWPKQFRLRIYDKLPRYVLLCFLGVCWRMGCRLKRGLTARVLVRTIMDGSTAVMTLGTATGVCVCVIRSIMKNWKIGPNKPLCSNPFCKWFWSGLWVLKHLLTGYLER